MTTSSNAKNTRKSEEDRRWKEHWNRLVREFEASSAETDRCIAKLEALEELAKR
ncbi:MAG TPA: hypothetical protein VGI73_07410 [Solirubrobacterales bacterium]|jgi:hypothetical protein